MTDCTNAEMRDLLPDVAAETLSTAEMARVRLHVERCSVCAEELALVQQVRAMRASSVTIDVGAIVAKLPRPTPKTVSGTVTSTASRDAAGVDEDGVISLDARRLSAKQNPRHLATRARGAWKVAATLGVIVAGGWSVMMVRSGGIPSMQVQADSVPLTDVVTGVPSIRTASDSGSAAVGEPSSDTQRDNGAAISFGAMTDLTDEELSRVLDRLEKWDGATSIEAASTPPILPTTTGDVRE